jgi:hypothetical protein
MREYAHDFVVREPELGFPVMQNVPAPAAGTAAIDNPGHLVQGVEGPYEMEELNQPVSSNESAMAAKARYLPVLW